MTSNSVNGVSVKYAPLRELSDSDLEFLVRMSIKMPEFLYELYVEIRERNNPVFNKILDDLYLKYEEARLSKALVENPYLARIYIDAGASIEDVTRKFKDFREQIKRGGKYIPALRYMAQRFLGADELARVFPGGEIPSKINRIGFEDACKNIAAVMSGRGRKFNAWEKLCFDFAVEFSCRYPNQDVQRPIISGVVSNKAKANDNGKDTKRPATWREAIKKLRHARLHPDAEKIHRLRGHNDWADASPLKMVGYSVDAKEGLPEKERRELLSDFCEIVELPSGLPKEYILPWGEAGSKVRVARVARHLGFLMQNFRRQDPVKFARAIECWRRDFEFIQSKYQSMLSPGEWAQALRG